MIEKFTNSSRLAGCVTFAGSLLLIGLFGATSDAQDSSLYRQGARTNQHISLQDVSLISRDYQPPPEVKLHDVITVVVDEKSLYHAKAIMDREKKASFDAVLEDNPILKKLSLKPSPQSQGDPRLKAGFDSQSEADARLRSDERIAFSIAVKVIEVRPNGNLVLEGHRQIRNNEESWEQSLTGVIRPEKVEAGNLAKAENIAELMIFKRERGEIRDGYRRGWLLRFLDRVQTF